MKSVFLILYRCGDPFNYTLTIEDMPAMMKCEGCCVKLVQNIGTPLYSVRRTCTDKLSKSASFNFEHYLGPQRKKSITSSDTKKSTVSIQKTEYKVL